MTRDFQNLSRDISRLGREHSDRGLEASDLNEDPFVQFAVWLEDALKAGIVLPNAMTLATAGADAIPTARMVLLKGFDDRGFLFFSNYESRKGKELAANPNAALVFYWPEVERQVGITGGVLRVEKSESEDYFNSRPLGSRIGAWASPQSEVIASREELEARAGELMDQYPDGDIPLPANWGGYRLIPSRFEFWQSRPNRLHDRFRYERVEAGGWSIDRLAP